MILALETSCDDTCAAVVTDRGEVLSNVIASQGLLHERYGGVVPEIASRRHLELIDAVVDDALESAGATLGEADLIAVTRGPGLIGALLVGVSSAKALAAARGLPLAPVDHLAGHVLATTCPCRWSTGTSGRRWAAASAFADDSPTSRAPIRPGARVTATRSTSPSPTPARSSASAVTASTSSRWRRAASSGTTPP